MIHLGLNPAGKAQALRDYCAGHDIKKIVVCSPSKFDFDAGELPVPVEFIDWPEIIMYRTFYRLLQEIDARTLVVVSECLRTQNRHDLTYNCIRHFLTQAGHVLVFQWLPLIDDMQDFMILFDFATGSRWKRERYDVDLLEQVSVVAHEHAPVLRPVRVPASARLQADYEREKAKLFAGIGIKDPHTIPRNLYLLGGKAKLGQLPEGTTCIGRNNRFKLPGMATYKESSYPSAPYLVFELPHNFIDFADFSALSMQTEFDVLATDLKVDAWYMDRYALWAERVEHGYADLRQFAQRA